MTIAKTKSHTQALPTSGIRDNPHRGSVGSFLQGKIQSGSRLSIVSAYFTPSRSGSEASGFAQSRNVRQWEGTMSELKLKQDIAQSLNRCLDGNLADCTQNLFQVLGYQNHRR
ncbi:MAG: hypothetical protein ACKO24_07850 [Leptolyngbyaceae cyanobacterium]